MNTLNTLNQSISVLIADNHPVTCVGIRTVLKEQVDIKIVGEVKDGKDLEPMLTKANPNILLLEPTMPGIQLLEIGKLLLNHPGTNTIILTSHDQDYYLAKAIETGVVMGFLNKEETPQKLIEAIRLVARGNVIFTKVQLTQANNWRKKVDKLWNNLTMRERQTLSLLVNGQSTQQIADKLTIRTCTVETHIGNILAKLSVSSRTDAIIWAWQYGLVGKASYLECFLTTNLAKSPDINGGYADDDSLNIN